ncbi:unnamed protein product [Effrenium voratum]|uniref:Uncharacterized protein n=1 Tax=Effrenium voratum TaxID=2562239 RepID=A0AA36MKR4_9DINO|nr:unnamed protein product [Effrenium voratum]
MNEMKQKNKGSGGILAQAAAFAKRVRGHEGNVVASAVSFVDPENCLVKILYLLYRFTDEDDFPYLPRKLGTCDIGWSFSLGQTAGGGLFD